MDRMNRLQRSLWMALAHMEEALILARIAINANLRPGDAPGQLDSEPGRAHNIANE